MRQAHHVKALFELVSGSIVGGEHKALHTTEIDLTPSPGSKMAGGLFSSTCA